MNDEITKKVVNMYTQYPYPFVGTHNNMFKDIVLPEIMKIGNIDRILEAGCGTGNVAIEIAQLLPEIEVVAIDITKKSIEIARSNAKKLGLKNICFKQSNLLDYDNNLGIFDFIHCQGVIHHLSSPEIGMRTINMYLKQNGFAYIWLYMLLGRKEILEVREILKYLVDNNDADFNYKMSVLTTVIKNINICNNGGRHDDKPVNSKLLNNIEKGIIFIKKRGWKKFLYLLLQKSFNIKKLAYSSKIKEIGLSDIKEIGLSDLYLHPHDVFYRMENVFELFDQSGFSFQKIMDGMSSSLSQCFGANNEITKLASSLPLKKQYQLIELFEKPSGIGFLVKKEK